jgi:hypothetical protein
MAVTPKRRNLPTSNNKNCQKYFAIFAMNSMDLDQHFLALERARSPNTIIGILREKLRD